MVLSFSKLVLPASISKELNKYTDGSFLLLASELIHLYSKPLFLACKTEYSRRDEKESNLLRAELKRQRRMVENVLRSICVGHCLCIPEHQAYGSDFFPIDSHLSQQNTTNKTARLKTQEADFKFILWTVVWQSGGSGKTFRDGTEFG